MYPYPHSRIYDLVVVLCLTLPSALAGGCGTELDDNADVEEQGRTSAAALVSPTDPSATLGANCLIGTNLPACAPTLVMMDCVVETQEADTQPRPVTCCGQPHDNRGIRFMNCVATGSRRERVLQTQGDDPGEPRLR